MIDFIKIVVKKLLLLLFVCVLSPHQTTTRTNAFLVPQPLCRQQRRQQQQKLNPPSSMILLQRQPQQSHHHHHQQQHPGLWHQEQRPPPSSSSSQQQRLFHREEESTSTPPTEHLADTVQQQTKQRVDHRITRSRWLNPIIRMRWLNKLLQQLSSFWMTMKNNDNWKTKSWCLSNISKTGWMKRIRQYTVVITMVFLIMFGSLGGGGGENSNACWAAVSAGRAGGSFGPSSSRPSMSRPSSPTRSYSRPPSRSYYTSPPSRPQPRTKIRTRHVYHYNYLPRPPPVHTSTEVYHVTSTPTPPMSKAEILVIGGVATGVVAFGVADHFRNSNNNDRHDGRSDDLYLRNGRSQWNDNNDGYMNERTPLSTSSISSSLGYGISVLSLTVSLSVSNRDNDNYDDDNNIHTNGTKFNSSILSKLRNLSINANTETRKGVQDLISSSTLELLRNENTINSVDFTCTNYNDYKVAEKQFNRISIMKRSKFDKETGTYVPKKRDKSLCRCIRDDVFLF